MYSGDGVNIFRVPLHEEVLWSLSADIGLFGLEGVAQLGVMATYDPPVVADTARVEAGGP